jgi:hypothetical protein
MFKPHTGEFKFENKYAGRKLTAQSFEQHFVDFLHDGNQVLIHHVSMLQRKLKLLLHSIMQLPACRFFGSSLLVIYDGDSLADSEIDIRMIDFAHTVTKGISWVYTPCLISWIECRNCIMPDLDRLTATPLMFSFYV